MMHQAWWVAQSAWGTYRRATRPVRQARHVTRATRRTVAPVTHFGDEADAWAGGGRAPRLIRWAAWVLILFYPLWLAGSPDAGEDMDAAPGENWFHDSPGGELVTWSVCSPAAPDLVTPIEDADDGGGTLAGDLLVGVLDGLDRLAEDVLDPAKAREYGEWVVDRVGAVVGKAADLFTGDYNPGAEFTAWKTGVQSGDACQAPDVPAGPDVIPAVSGSGSNGWGGYANGRIPSAALCGLETAPGQLARCDAAAAFDALSRAFAADHGSLISVTDAYRTYESQVRLRAAKPSLAAVPGTSNHGWGVAFDLGGGINSFGTVEHEWMRANAGRFGFFHPSWAQQGGSKPEAWHWQYEGGTVRT